MSFISSTGDKSLMLLVIVIWWKATRLLWVDISSIKSLKISNLWLKVFKNILVLLDSLLKLSRVIVVYEYSK